MRPPTPKYSGSSRARRDQRDRVPEGSRCRDGCRTGDRASRRTRRRRNRERRTARGSTCPGQSGGNAELEAETKLLVRSSKLLLDLVGGGRASTAVVDASASATIRVSDIMELILSGASFRRSDWVDVTIRCDRLAAYRRFDVCGCMWLRSDGAENRATKSGRKRTADRAGRNARRRVSQADRAAEARGEDCTTPAAAPNSEPPGSACATGPASPFIAVQPDAGA